MVEQTLFFKAVNTDLASFGAPHIVWTPNIRVELPANETVGTKLCKPGLLHAATVATEALVSHTGASLWPCRLMSVTPAAELVTSTQHPHKVGCVAWDVQEELPAHNVFGVFGRQTVEIIERAKSLSADEISRLSADSAAYWAADRAASWAADRAAYRAAYWAAHRAAHGAALATVTWGLATADGPYTFAMRDLLIAPWAEVIGLPEGLV